MIIYIHVVIIHVRVFNLFDHLLPRQTSSVATPEHEVLYTVLCHSSSYSMSTGPGACAVNAVWPETP